MANPRLGVDLAGLDLRTNLQGDLALSADVENVKAAILRRLDTPISGLFSHPWYGNPLHDILSNEIDNNFESRAIAAINECLSQEPRIEVSQISVTVKPEQRRVVFVITYSIVSEADFSNLVWEVALP